MKKIFTLTAVSVILNMTLGGIVWWKFFKSDRSDKQEYISQSNPNQPNKKRRRKVEKVFNIAMLTPETSKPILDIQEGFETTFHNLSDSTAVTNIKVYDSKGDRTLLRSHVEAVSQAKYDLIFTIGMACTKMMKEVLCKRDKKTPVVFCAVKDPVGTEIILNEQAPGCNITGVTGSQDWKTQVELLTLVKKNIKRVLLVYDPTGLGGYMEQWRKEVDDCFKAKGIETKGVQISNVNEIVAKTSPFIEMADVVMTLRDGTVNSGLPALAKLCDRYHVPLYSSFSDALDRGAVMSFAVDERDSGVLAAHHAYDILIKGMNPAEMPVKNLDICYKLLVNKKLMKQQNLEIDPQIEFLMKHARIIEDGLVEANK